MRQIRAPRFCFLYNNAIDAAQGRAGEKMRLCRRAALSIGAGQGIPAVLG